MEEILASIRRIIADDQSLPRGESAASLDAASDPPAGAPAPAHEPLPVHVLHPVHQLEAGEATRGAIAGPDRDHEKAATLAAAMARGSIAAPQYASPAGLEHTVAHAAPEAAAEPHAAIDGHRRPEPAFPAPLEPEEAPPVIDQDVHEAGADAEPVRPAEPPATVSATTRHSVVSAFNTLAAARLAGNSEELRSLAKDMLRPLIATWLDDNLPALVERLVRDEIERVAHGGP